MPAGGHLRLLGGDVVPFRFPAEPPQVVPGGVAADDPAFGQVFDLAALLPGPPFELGEAFVTGGQDAAGHEDLAQVAGDLAGRVAVERAVAGRLAGMADLGIRSNVPQDGSPARFPPDGTICLQEGQRLPHRTPRCFEAGGQLPFGRQPRARLESSAS